MKLHDSNVELPFHQSFEYRFPYGDEGAATALIKRGASISLNAACCVLVQICYPLDPSIVSKTRMRALVQEWVETIEHPLKPPLLRCADALIEKAPLSAGEMIELMNHIGKYDGQLAALALAKVTLDINDTDEAGDTVDRVGQEIRRRWGRPAPIEAADSH